MTNSSSINLLTVEQTAEEANPDDEPPLISNDWCLLAPNQIVPQFYNDTEQGFNHAEVEKWLNQYSVVDVLAAPFIWRADLLRNMHAHSN